MCLSIALHRPDDVLGEGVHAGYQWLIMNNGTGYRCGYVQLPKGHPWHGLDYDDANEVMDVPVHGGLTFSEPDEPCDALGDDDAWWLGFDCAHGFDLPDPDLKTDRTDEQSRAILALYHNTGAEVRTQAYVESQCRTLCEAARKVR